jgi:hypothetical protein
MMQTSEIVQTKFAHNQLPAISKALECLLPGYGFLGGVGYAAA